MDYINFILLIYLINATDFQPTITRLVKELQDAHDEIHDLKRHN